MSNPCSLQFLYYIYLQTVYMSLFKSNVYAKQNHRQHLFQTFNVPNGFLIQINIQQLPSRSSIVAGPNQTIYVEGVHKSFIIHIDGW